MLTAERPDPGRPADEFSGSGRGSARTCRAPFWNCRSAADPASRARFRERFEFSEVCGADDSVGQSDNPSCSRWVGRMRLMPDLDLIGQGWKFPIKVSAKGGLSYSSGPERIQDAIWIVLSTSLGERLMLPDFGAGVKDYVFQDNSDVIRTRLQTAINEALVKWE